MRSLKDLFNRLSLNHLAPAANAAQLGTLLCLSPVTVNLTGATTSKFTLPQNMKAASILSAAVTAGSVTGKCTPVISATPATHEVTITVTGDIQFNNSTDAVTAASVTYIPEEGEVYTELLSVASNAATFLGSRQSRVLLSCTRTAATALGALTVSPQGGGATTGLVALNAAGTGIVTAAADAVTQVSVTYVALPVVGAAATLKTANQSY
jgi:hypothetical protein